MRFTDGKVNSFKELMNEIFYDWGFSPNPQLRRDSSGVWINKTGVFFDDGRIILSYKTTDLEVSPEDFKKLNEIYEMYEKDKDFMKIMDSIADRWHENDLQEASGHFKIGDLQIYPKDDFKYYSKNKYKSEYKISKLTYQKLVKFYQLLL